MKAWENWKWSILNSEVAGTNCKLTIKMFLQRWLHYMTVFITNCVWCLVPEGIIFLSFLTCYRYLVRCVNTNMHNTCCENKFLCVRKQNVKKQKHLHVMHFNNKFTEKYNSQSFPLSYYFTQPDDQIPRSLLHILFVYSMIPCPFQEADRIPNDVCH